EGVGKSSIVSTFVSRHFSELVPGILTRVRLPPDPYLSNCTSTIIDTQEGDTSLSNALSPLRNVDAIVLVYDLDKMETFNRLESHWLPLIERCYNDELPVIIAGNKMDLLHQSSSHFARSRQNIIALLQRFKFVRQVIKCSARNLLNVDDVFRKAQEAVLYPLTPLYDLNTGKLTASCTRALTRIFRVFDVDKDGLLSDSELNAFQHKIWGVTLFERDFSGWKKVVIRDGKFTVAGFLAIFDVFISQNRMETPWKVLRTFGYDDGLVLTIPEPISGNDFAPFHPKEWSLTESEVRFLESMFRQFDSDGDGYLSPEDMQSVFSVLSAPLPPWSERANRLFQVDVTEHSFTQTSKPLSFLSWMNLWHMMCTISPSVCRRELFTLGFIPELLESEKETTAYTRRLCKVNPNSSPSTDTPTTVVKALILGSKGSGKTMLVRKLHRWQRGNDHTLETSSAHPTTSCSVSKATLPSLNSTTDIHLILTEVSDRDAGKGNQRDRLGLLLSGRVYDMAVLVFDSADASSWAFVRDMETKLLNEDVPRVFVATTSGGKIDSDVQSLPAFEHCRDMDLEPPLVLSLDDISKDSSALKYLLCCARHQHQNGDEFRS
ncbi:ras-related protein, partial [Thalassiosira pseudonana CCMP1335]